MNVDADVLFLPLTLLVIISVAVINILVFFSFICEVYVLSALLGDYTCLMQMLCKYAAPLLVFAVIWNAKIVAKMSTPTALEKVVLSIKTNVDQIH